MKDLKTNEVNLAIIFIDPWKHIDRNKPFDVPENVFVVGNSRIKIPEDRSSPNKFSYDKIRSVSILPSEKTKAITLII